MRLRRRQPGLPCWLGWALAVPGLEQEQLAADPQMHEHACEGQWRGQKQKQKQKQK